MPVLVEEAVELLAPWREGSSGLFVDATVGLGGHAAALLAAGERRGGGIRLVGIDRDPAALARSARRLAPWGERVRLVAGNFHQLAERVAAAGAAAGVEAGGKGVLAGVLADLGVSSLQLGTAARGFSFRLDGPLDMRMSGPMERAGAGGRDESEESEIGGGTTAAEIVNTASEAELEKIFREYGEERQARRIARAIVSARQREPIERTGELAALVGRAKGGPREPRIDPATRVFQALRIAVNQELAGLESFIQQAVDLMEADGRLVIISYHSLEDRIVKHGLRALDRGEVDRTTGRVRAESRAIELLTKKPVRPGEAEVAANPRARSARLRAARRL